MSKRALAESIVVALGMTFSRYTPAPQVQSLARALRESAERRERRRRSPHLAVEPHKRTRRPETDATSALR
jgi:hypothetical protein